MKTTYRQTNKAAWEEAYDKRTGSYAEEISIKIKQEPLAFLDLPLKQEIVKHDLRGKTIGQFCCNNGRELLSIAHYFGANAIGFDIASNMVEYANTQAKKLNVSATFYETDVLELSHEFDEEFDYLIITIGALCWFDDLKAFFSVASRVLKPGGKLILNESHPLSNMIATSSEEGYVPEYPKLLVHSYFNKEPSVENDGMGYMAGSYESKEFISFTHSFSNIINGMVQSGLHIERLEESDFDISSLFPNLSSEGLPLSFLAIAKKDI